MWNQMYIFAEDKMRFGSIKSGKTTFSRLAVALTFHSLCRTFSRLAVALTFHSLCRR